MSKKSIVYIVIIFILISVGYETKMGLKLTHPRLYSKYVEKYSEEFNIDENLVYSIIKVESKFNKKAESNKGAKGLMQISDITRDWAIDELALGEIDIFNPEDNIRIGCWYIDKLRNQFGDLQLVIAAYNGGSGNVTEWLGDSEYSEDGLSLTKIPFEETSNYVKKVTNNYDEYKRLYE